MKHGSPFQHDTNYFTELLVKTSHWNPSKLTKYDSFLWRKAHSHCQIICGKLLVFYDCSDTFERIVYVTTHSAVYNCTYCMVEYYAALLLPGLWWKLRQSESRTLLGRSGPTMTQSYLRSYLHDYLRSYLHDYLTPQLHKCFCSRGGNSHALFIIVNFKHDFKLSAYPDWENYNDQTYSCPRD